MIDLQMVVKIHSIAIFQHLNWDSGSCVSWSGIWKEKMRMKWENIWKNLLKSLCEMKSSNVKTTLKQLTHSPLNTDNLNQINQKNPNNPKIQTHGTEKVLLPSIVGDVEHIMQSHHSRMLHFLLDLVFSVSVSHVICLLLIIPMPVHLVQLTRHILHRLKIKRLKMGIYVRLRLSKNLKICFSLLILYTKNRGSEN